MAEEKVTEPSQIDQPIGPVQPGAVVTPGGENPPLQTSGEGNKPAQKPAPVVVTTPKKDIPKEQPPTMPIINPEPLPQPLPAPEASKRPDTPGSITWTASEFVAHDKSAGWYLALSGVSILLSGVIYLVTHDFISVAVVVVAALMFGVYGARKPRQLEYRLDPHGIGIGHKQYGYDEFRTFSVIPEGAFASIVFMPLKRFSPPITIYYAPEDEDKIIDLLSEKLPYEEMRRDPIDSLMRHIRF